MIPNSVLRGPSKYWTAVVQLDGQLFDLAGELPTNGLGQEAEPKPKSN